MRRGRIYKKVGIPRAGYRRKKVSQSIADAFNIAIYGILEAFYQERNMRVHLIAGLAVLTVAMILPVSKYDLLWLGSAIAAVFVTETLNTAIEMLVDMVSMRENPQARAVKDISAGAVLLSVFYSLFVGFIVFISKLKEAYKVLSVKLNSSPEYLLLVAFFLPMLVVVLIKIYSHTHDDEYATWEPLRGGIVSGHTALAFCLATYSALIGDSILVAISSYILAVLVAQSRVEGGIHKPVEVLIGAVVGITIGLLLVVLLKVTG